MKHTSAIFQDIDQIRIADSCEELKKASENEHVNVHAWSHPPYPGEQVDPDYLPEIRSLGFWDITKSQTWGLGSHCNEGIEFSFLLGGKVEFGVSQHIQELKSGQVAITRPWQFHQIGNPDLSPSKLFWLILDVKVRRPNQAWQWPDWVLLSPQELNQLTSLLRHNEQAIWDTNSEVFGILKKFTDLIENEQPENNQTKLKLYSNELLLALLHLLISKKPSIDSHLSTSERVVEMFLDALKDHIDEDWTLENMAKQCGLSRSQFASYCKVITNMTPVQYLNHCRFQTATKMLVEQPEMNIGEIANACGFKSLAYFSARFQKLRGCSPKNYRHGTSED
ncbi:helix-turn-helix transcriptional regulator [Verrucomicrobiaceae bacterium N1E253]|uniref:Helix-turn-helix transcriptional regulator n=1 Tax=Oceaniferula marina TaxID=2748318 RepID=A0A851GHX6_9BACT|nr:AraC family transcriptional regulator [Oceaniferula marina]NWK57378.1 helix-turn-helix transcriptional regulator [Oceaniferula marina]